MVDLHGKGMQMFHHKAFVIRWLILFAPILLKLCTVSPVPPFTDNRSFGIRDNYLYGNIHCYCSFFLFFQILSVA